MTHTLESDQVAEAIGIIDQYLAGLSQRNLIASTEVTNILLDVRSVMAAAPAEAAPVH